MKTKILNLIFTGLIVSGAVISGCSKNESVQELNQNPQLLKSTQANATATKSILNTDLVVNYASDNGVNITTQFKDFTFNFQGTAPAGQAHVWNDLLAQTGTWKFVGGTDVFEIKYPAEIFEQLAFLNRTWRIDETNESVFRLYTMDGDEVHFRVK